MDNAHWSARQALAHRDRGPPVHPHVFALILANAALLGVETYRRLTQDW
ncbi:hypothetical protein [Streptomyces sp. P3]|nr:hypothetical protein [Streptomyces sp. P3]